MRSFGASPRSQSLLKLFNRPKVQDQSIEPGLSTLLEYSKLRRLDARLPPRHQVEAALEEFLAYRHRKRASLSDEHAKYVLDGIKYLDGHSDTKWIDEIDRLALELLPQDHSLLTETHRNMALYLHAKYIALCKAIEQLPSATILLHVVRVLCAAGAPAQARGLLDDYYQMATKSVPRRLYPAGTDEAAEKSILRSCWLHILEKFKAIDQEANMLTTLAVRQKYDTDGLDRAACALMCQIYAARDKTKECQEWYNKYTQAERTDADQDDMILAIATDLYSALFEACARNDMRDWGQTLTQKAIEDLPAKTAWDLILIWAAQTGKGIDHVEAMMDTVDEAGRKPGANAGAKVDISTINRLLRFAIARNDPYTAERYVTIGRNRGLEADAETLRLQMEYRLSVDDLSGALTAYKNSQSHDLSLNQDIPAVNRLICAMCSSSQYDFDSIMDIVADLGERQARLSADAVSALARLHLTRGETKDVGDLLSTYTADLSAKDRSRIVKDLVRFSVDPASDTATAWDTYTALDTFFPAMDRKQRTVMMHDFFRRGHTDLAVNVFLSMNAHNRRPDTRATSETYIAVLDGIANAVDPKGLQTVHNRFNLDDGIEASTALRNAFMAAYTAIGGGPRALRFWDDIAASREGPDMRSIVLAFKACAAAPLGVAKAREIWKKIQVAGLELTSELWAEYLGTLMADNVDLACKELDHAWDEGEVPGLGTAT